MFLGVQNTDVEPEYNLLMKKLLFILTSLLCLGLVSFLTWQFYLIKAKPSTSYIMEIGESDRSYSNRGNPGVRKNCPLGYSATGSRESFPPQIICRPWLEVISWQVLK